MDWLLRSEFWVTFMTLTGLEIVLGIDNVIFHSLTIAKLPAQYQRRARIAGMALAIVMRFALLAALVWFMGLSVSPHSVPQQLAGAKFHLSGRDIILIVGGFFLLIKSCLELCSVRDSDDSTRDRRKISNSSLSKKGVISCIAQIVLLDVVFSLDSVITAVGMVSDVRAIMFAILVSVVMMMFSSTAIGNFLKERERLRIIAFSFVALVGAVLMAEGFGIVVPKSHVYAALGFALLIEYGISRSLTHKSAKTRSSSRNLRHLPVSTSSYMKPQWR